MRNLLLLIVVSLSGFTGETPQHSGPNLLAAPATTISLAPTQGTPGSLFVGSGRVTRGSAGVRLLWDDGRAAFGLAEGPVDAEGSFAVSLRVPEGTAEGTARVIALPFGSAGDDQGSAAFTVLPSRPGPLNGRVVTDLAGTEVGVARATVKLLSNKGEPIALTQTDAQGGYSFPEIPQGSYTLVMVADDYYAPAGEINVPSGGANAGSFQMIPIEDLPAPAVVTFVGAIAVPLDALEHFSYTALVSDQSSAKKTGVIAHFATLPPEAGAVRIRFWADAAFPTNAPESDRAVRFEVLDAAGGTLWNIKKTVRTPVHAPEPVLNFPAYTSSFPSIFPLDMNVSSFPPGEVYLRVTPYIGGKPGYGKLYTIQMTDLKNRWFQPWVNHTPDPQTGLPIRYLGSGGLTYLFNGSLPRSNVLPFALDIPVPVFDYTFQNRLGLSVPEIQEVLEAEPWEVVRPGVIKPKLHTEVKLFSQDLSPDPFPILPVTDSNGHLKEYQLKRVTALGPTEFFNVTIYQNGPGIGCVNLCLLGCKVCAGWKVYVDFILGGKLDLQSQIYPDLGLETWIIPEVTGTLGGHARVKLVVCNLNADITGTVAVNFPFLYRSNPESAGFETPCIQLSGNVNGDLGCLGIGFGGGGSIGPYDLFGCTAPIAATATASTATAMPMPVDPAPSVAVGGDDEGLSVWVQDESTTGGMIQPFIYYRFFDGNLWLPGQRITSTPALVNEPKAVLLANGRAVAIWVQNKRPLAEIIANGSAELAHQEIFSSFWNGSQWSAPVALTANDVAEGSPDLAVSDTGDFAIAAWTHIQEPPGNNPDQVQSDNHFAVFDGSSWTTPQTIHLTSGKIDSQVGVKVDQAGGIWAIWMRDADADLTTFADRELLLARRTRTGWTVPERVPNTPPGAFSPSLAIDANNEPFVVFLAPPHLKGELTSGLGNRSALWYARRSPDGWVTRGVRDRAGKPVYAEDPTVEITSDGKAIIVLRRFGEDLVHQTGDLASITADLSLPAVQFSGDYLTRDGQSNWKVGYALNPRSQQSLVVSVKQSPLSQGFEPDQGMAAVSANRSLSPAALNGPAISSVALEYLPDLTVSDEDISFSNSHPLPNDSITISAIVRNQGFRAFNGEVLVKFYDQPVLPDSLPFQTATIAGPLEQGDTALARATYTVREGGIKRITVIIDRDAAVPESDERNNAASKILGEIPPPQNLVIVPDPVTGSMKLEWDASPTAGLERYQVFRAEEGQRVFELVGTTASSSFVDFLAKPGRKYQYLIVVKDQFGAEASISAAELYAVPPAPEPAAPKLFVQNAADQVGVSWFDQQLSFELQYTENLGGTPRVWNRQTEGVFRDGGQHQFITSATSRARFYRLIKQ
jgi:hypothetical protein